jgi:hypothetical protein
MGWPHEAHVNHILNIGSCYLVNHRISVTKVIRLMSRDKKTYVCIDNQTYQTNKQTNKLGERSVALFNVKVNYTRN